MRAGQCIEDAESKREAIRARCKEKGIAILPYGAAWWLKGDDFSLVIYDLANIDVKRLDEPTRYPSSRGVKICFK